MEILCKEKESNLLKVSVTEENIDKLTSYLNKSYEQIKDKVKLKGFRKGKVPLSIFRQRHTGVELYEESLKYLINDMYKFIFDSCCGIQSLGDPEINILEYDFNKKVVIEFIIIIKPEVKLPHMQTLDLDKENISKELTVTDEEVQRQMDNYLDRYSYMEVTDQPANLGDTVIIDFIGYKDGKEFEGGSANNYSLTLGNNTFIEGFEDGLLGVKEGDSRELELKFPKDYSNKDLADCNVIFKVKVNTVKKKVKPEMTESFFEKVSKDKKAKIESIESLKSLLKEEVLSNKRNYEDQKLKEKILQSLIDKTKLILPEKLIDQHYDKAMVEYNNNIRKYKINEEEYLKSQNITKEEFEEQLKNRINKQIKTQLIIEKYTDEKDIQVSEKEIREYINNNFKNNLGIDKNKVFYEETKYFLLVDKIVNDILLTIKGNKCSKNI